MLRKWFKIGAKPTLSEKQLKNFLTIITRINMQRLKILCMFGIVIETIYGVLLLLGVMPYDGAGMIMIVATLGIAIIGVIILSDLQKKQRHFWNAFFINAGMIGLLLVSVFITFLRFLNNQPDILVYLGTLFILNILVIKKPLVAALQVSGSLCLLVILIALNKPDLFDYSIIYNGFGFAFIAIFSSIMLYNNQVKIFIEQQQAEEANEKLRAISQTDQLTGLNNRRRIHEVLERQVQDHEKASEPFSVVMFDIDHYKVINDRFGHVCGDEILYELGSVLKNNLRIYDVAGRWGGDEFIMICCHTHLDEAINIAKRIQQKIYTHKFVHDLTIQISMGISQMVKDATIEQVILWADMALLQAKENGRNRIEVSEEISGGQRA